MVPGNLILAWQLKMNGNLNAGDILQLDESTNNLERIDTENFPGLLFIIHQVLYM